MALCQDFTATSCTRPAIPASATSARSRPAVCASAAPPTNSRRQPRPGNLAGAGLYVDSTCIDCDACRWMAPATFSSSNGGSVVTAQPQDQGERQAALRALLSCPTFSIHVEDAARGELAAARDAFPLPVAGTSAVFHLGHHSEASYSAAPWFVLREGELEGQSRPSGGNVMIDCPRWTPSLAQRLEQLGGVRWIVLTHRDDVGDHAKWAAHFGADRIIHRLEVNRRQGTDAAEVQLTGEGPWRLGDEETGDVEIVFTPGHTAGCISLLYKPDRVLFTGDHLAASASLEKRRLTTFPRYNWHDHGKQLRSVRSLVGLDFLHVLPGHGRPAHFADLQEQQAALEEVLREEGAALAAL